MIFKPKRMAAMKRLVGLLAAACVLAVAAGCSSTGGGKGGAYDVAPGTVGAAAPAIVAAANAAKSMAADDVVLFYYRADGAYDKWGLWLWPTGGDGEPGYNATAGKAQTSGGGVAYWNISRLAPDIAKKVQAGDKKLNFIIRDASWNKDPGIDQAMDLSAAKKHIVMSGDASVYEVADEVRPAITGASAQSATAVRAQLSVTLGLSTEAGANGFSLVAADGRTAAVSDVRNADNPNNRSRNNARNILIDLAEPLDVSVEWRLKHDAFGPQDGIAVSMQGAVKGTPKKYDGSDLGLALSGGKASFKIWAPTAGSVTLLLYSDVADVGSFNAASVAAKAVGSTTDASLEGKPAARKAMAADNSTGVWSLTLDGYSAYKYYKYEIANGGTKYYVCDINAKAASPDAIAAQIVDINADSAAKPSGWSDSYKNPFGNDGTEAKGYTDAVIYEMHVTDWSNAEDAGAGDVGKYMTLSEGGKVISHIKELGATHVQILPVFEFAETVANPYYNWGYNPYHYNVPESRYVKDGRDGVDAVRQMRQMVKAFQDAGIAVIMDVVYNHTSGTGTGSLYDSTVPYYYYRFDKGGAYSNGSGCGNEVDTEAPMAKKYIIDSLKHWMTDYHINGFRFDLMGCMSKETMQEIYSELSKIDRNVMVYGEPWTGGASAVRNGTTKAVSVGAMGVGAFDDDFRDAIKGAEFGGFKKGQVQGTFGDEGIVNGLIGQPGRNKRNETGRPGLALHYVECHDNYTLFDKLAISNLGKSKFGGDLFNAIGDAGLEAVRAQDKLSAAYVFLSQGTPFINGGQEFLRTKMGNENSYNTSGKTNKIDLAYKDAYSDVYNTYKGLIALRKANPAAFGANKGAKAETLAPGVTKYTAGNFLVYFNATDTSASLAADGRKTAVDVSSGTPTDAPVPESIPAKGFVILKK